MKERERVSVKLDIRELLEASIVGCVRHCGNLKKGRKRVFGHSVKQGFSNHIGGTIGEFVVARHFGLNWSGAFKFRASDVGDWEVRAAPWDGRLIIHEDDNDDAKFVLVRDDEREWHTFHIEGWILASEAKKRTDWWQDPKGNRPAYWVPAEALNQIPIYEHTCLDHGEAWQRQDDAAEGTQDLET